MSGVLTAVKVAGVFLLLAATLIYIRRHDRGRLRVARKSNRPVAVLGQARLSKAASVAVVDIGGTAYAVAVTDQRVSLLLPDPVHLPAAFSAPDGDDADTDTDADADTEDTGDPPAPAAGIEHAHHHGHAAAPAKRYVGRFERAGSDRPSFGEALAQQFRVLTRREPEAVQLSDELLNREHFDAEIPTPERLALPVQRSGAEFDDSTTVTAEIAAVTATADGSAIDRSARTPGTTPG